MRHKTFVWSVLLTLLLGGCSLAAEVPQNIVVIGWDGAQRAHVNEMIERNELPNLVALSNEGAFVEVDVTTGATDTKAGWTQILTGYNPDKTSVYGNNDFQPIPVGYSVFERLESFLGPDNIVTMAVIGKKGHVDADGPQKVPYDEWLANEERIQQRRNRRPGRVNLRGGEIVEEDGQKFVLVPGKPWYNAQGSMDLFLNGLNQNEKVGTTALAKLEENQGKRFFFFIHFAEPDHAGHSYGENSQEYTDGIKDDDTWTGKIIDKLKQLGLYEKTLIYIAVDHGFNEGATGHTYAPYVFLATNDTTFVRKQGDRADVGAHILKRFGMDLTTIEPALDGIPYDEPAPERKAPPEKPGGRRQPAD